MASYVVMEPPSRTGGEIRMVRDGFSFVALILPFVWLLWHRMWIEALLVFAVAIALGVGGELTGFQDVAMGLSLLVSIYVALEGASLRVAALRRQGWREAGVVDAVSEDEAMLRYFDIHGEPSYGSDAPPREMQRPVAAASSAAPALGLFSYPGRR
ncbi:DUF2628 domain-containing protein [Mesorhizobium sp. Z1-4]|uniref:DUF2628 domain-containing protein n=1 Tax=Mesorhizobium sp. Z1-4 TaxID=2448478 RepID=UPI000FDA6992|nr:DUF2628 domain-containing protein [Mesorhizobium sp. Z1-4]